MGRLDDALAVCRTPQAEGRILLKKGFTLEQMGDAEAALEALSAALTLIDPVEEPRQVFGAQFNRVVNFLHLDRCKEACTLLPEVPSPLPPPVTHSLPTSSSASEDTTSR